MVTKKSLDPYKQIIIALLCDVQTLHDRYFTKKALRQTIAKIECRLAFEGIGFLTKTLPRLGKALDRALSGECIIDSITLGFKPQPDSKLPMLFGELFNRVFSSDGQVLRDPDVTSIKSLRQILFIFYKLELPYDSKLEQKVISKFIETEKQLFVWNEYFDEIIKASDKDPFWRFEVLPKGLKPIIRCARRLLSNLFSQFDLSDIHPKHGPGAVSTKERLWTKYTWSVISPRILETYPLDAYFFASLGHVCDELDGNCTIKLKESSARVLLVPKDSRGPRLISCEPLDFQWIQQGLGKAIVQLVESHPLTRYNIHFTDQSPNQRGARLGSFNGSYATLDLNEASDRVTTGLVRLLFPKHISDALMNCRSLSTTLPSGEELRLNKFAPMGSALCFPVLALTIWAILTAGLSDTAECLRCGRCICNDCSREHLLVYGDDVIVPTAKAANAIGLLESFGLLVNRDKSFLTGFFRESCGVDAFKGQDVTPVRIRTVWSCHQSPDVYTSYIAYANTLYDRGYFNAYDEIVGRLFAIYGEIPGDDMHLTCPSLRVVPESHRPNIRRTNSDLQKLEWFVWDIKSPKIRRKIGGWKMLLRFFSEATNQTPFGSWDPLNVGPADAGVGSSNEPFSVSLYTKRKTSCLVHRWR